jgi:hypothetical protein
MKSLKLLIIISTVMLILIPARGQATETLYGITFDQQLITINSSTGLGNLVGNLDTAMGGFGLATRSGKLYTFDQTADRIRELDPLTAHTLNTINIGVATIGEGGITFRSDGIGFMSRSSGGIGTLWSFDITVPSATNISGDDGLRPSMDGLDFNSTDILYGISQSSNVYGSHKLYTINQTTGETALIGDIGITDDDTLSGFAFRSDGVLFAEINDSLYIINPSNGQATFVGRIGFERISGLTFVGEGKVPEPSTMLLLGSGLIGLAGYGRKKLFKK